MPSSFTATPLLPSFPLSMPLDGEVITHTTLISNVIEPGFNYTAFVDQRLDGVTGAPTGDSVTRYCDTPMLPTSASWTVQATGNYSTSAATAQTIMVPISASVLPHGVTLTGVTVTIFPAAHASIAGLTLPIIDLYKYDSTVGLTQIGATTPDPSTTFTQYSAVHDISMTGLSENIDRSDTRYFISLTSEHGGGTAAASMLAVAALVTYAAI